MFSQTHRSLIKADFFLIWVLKGPPILPQTFRKKAEESKDIKTSYKVIDIH